MKNNRIQLHNWERRVLKARYMEVKNTKVQLQDPKLVLDQKEKMGQRNQATYNQLRI